MAVISFMRTGEGVRHTAVMAAPRKVYDLNAWVKSARQHLPVIPDWGFREVHVDSDLISLELIGPNFEQGFLNIDRTQAKHGMS